MGEGKKITAECLKILVLPLQVSFMLEMSDLLHLKCLTHVYFSLQNPHGQG